MKKEMLKKQIAQQLVAIFEMGDKDECSWKHIGHSFAAQLFFGDYLMGEDYFDPFGRPATDSELEHLDQHWATIEFLLDGEDVEFIEEIAQELAQEDGRLMYLDVYFETYKEASDRSME